MFNNFFGKSEPRKFKFYNPNLLCDDMRGLKETLRSWRSLKTFTFLQWPSTFSEQFTRRKMGPFGPWDILKYTFIHIQQVLMLRRVQNSDTYKGWTCMTVFLFLGMHARVKCTHRHYSAWFDEYETICSDWQTVSINVYFHKTYDLNWYKT